MLTIYGIPISVHVRKTILTALMKGVAFKIEPVIRFKSTAGMGRAQSDRSHTRGHRW